MGKIVYKVYGDNHTVTDFYVGIIAEAFKSCGYTVIEISINEINLDKKAPIIVLTALDLFKWYCKGFRCILMWNQGTIPEESYMRRHSRIKWCILSLLEWWGLKKARINFFVSESQKRYFEKQYHLNLTTNGYVMPCYNCELDETSFLNNNKYSNNIFAYTGSFTAPWQYIDGNLKFYKKIEDKYGSAVFLKIFTPHQDIAEIKMKEYGIRNYSIGCVKPEELPRELGCVKFGLLLREDNIVNNIATPTKLSTYMSCGLIPIVSSCIHDYACNMYSKFGFVLVNNDLDTTGVEELIESSVDYRSVYNSFCDYWKCHYNTQWHIENIKNIIRKHI